MYIFRTTKIRYIISGMCTVWSRRCFTGTTFTSVKVYYNILKTFQYILYVYMYGDVFHLTVFFNVCMYVESR